MIDKCCMEGTIPEDFDEVKPDRPDYAFWLVDKGELDVIDAIVASINPDLANSPETAYRYDGRHVYFSFHPWQLYKPAVEAGEESVVRAIRNFDIFLSRFDARGQLQRRELEITIATSYVGVLPPSEQP